jgi:hypothetical protein
VRIEPSRLDVSGVAWVVLESLDRAPHRVALTVLLATGVNVLAALARWRCRRMVLCESRFGSCAATLRAADVIPISVIVSSLGSRSSAPVPRTPRSRSPGIRARLPRLRPWLVGLGALLLLARCWPSFTRAARGPAPID